MARTETVVPVLLSNPPAVPEAPMPLRPVDPDFADTVAAGYVETDAEFGARIRGRL